MTAVQEPVKVHTIVVGAGPAGLAMGACLQQAGVSFLILEQADQVAVAWHRHYERLHLHTDKKHSALPFFPFPKEYPRYPSRVQMIDYLEAYARRFQLAPRLGQRVVSARRIHDAWRVETQDSHYQAENLVVATGYSREPLVATWPGQEGFKGRVLHSSEYRDGEAFRGQKVLVVGFGNSGGRSPSTSGRTGRRRAWPSAARSTSSRATCSESRSWRSASCRASCRRGGPTR